jgi:hypothetical protein
MSRGQKIMTIVFWVIVVIFLVTAFLAFVDHGYFWLGFASLIAMLVARSLKSRFKSKPDSSDDCTGLDFNGFHPVVLKMAAALREEAESKNGRP